MVSVVEVAAQIRDVEAEIRKTESAIQFAFSKIDFNNLEAPSSIIWINEKERLGKKEEDLRKKEEDLRKFLIEKELLSTKEGLF